MQAQAAKEENEKGNEKDAIAIAKTEAATAQYFKQEAMTEEKLSEIFTFTEESPYNGNVAKVVDGDVPIPLGFAYVQGTKKDTGLIVVDGYGNEFVWVPVDTFSDFAVLKSDGVNYRGQLWATSVTSDFGTKNTTYNANSGLREPAKVTYSEGTEFDNNEANINAILDRSNYTSLLDQFQKEYNAMAESVKIYGGFYVGRYETSWTGSKVASVQGTTPTEIFTTGTELGTGWTTEKTGSSANRATWYGLYAKQRELYNKESDSVVSGMIYGAQWDAIMNWMKDVPNPNSTQKNEADRIYIKDSVGMGNHSKGDGKYEKIATGTNDNYKVKNIYDLAGNFWEVTQEANAINCRILRGGESSASFPVSRRHNLTSPANATTNSTISSRLQLYIK